MKHKTITIFQMTSIIFFLIHHFFLASTNTFLNIANNDWLISYLLGVLLAFFAFRFIIKRQETYQKSIIFHSFGAIILLLVSFLYCLWQTATIIKVNFLQEGTIIQIIVLLCFIAYLISKKNMEQVANLSLLCFFFFFIFFSINIVSILPSLTIDYINPFFQEKQITIFKGAIYYFFMTTIPLLLLFYIKDEHCENKKKQKKYFYFAFSISHITILFQLLMLALGPSIAFSKQDPYPYMLIFHLFANTTVLDRFNYLFSYYILMDNIILLGILLTIIKTLSVDKYSQLVHKQHFPLLNLEHK